MMIKHVRHGGNDLRACKGQKMIRDGDGFYLVDGTENCETVSTKMVLVSQMGL